MPSELNRRTFLKGSLLTTAGAALSLSAPPGKGSAADAKSDALPSGKIGDLQISRLLLGGNLLTHFTHSRDLKYVYNLTAQYNTNEKIKETMALAEKHGVNTLVIHTVPNAMQVLREHRQDGGKIQWIICPTAPIEDSLTAYTKQVEELVENGVDAIYLWGVRADDLVAKGRIDLIAKTVEVAKKNGVPSGVGAHDLRVIVECEKNKIDADFYIKTLHHHKYPTAPRPDELKGVHREIPGYWCEDPQAVVDVMKDVKKPWIAFKVMAAGAIPPASAFPYAYQSGADHIIAGMFDFEIAADVKVAKQTLASVKRSRPWRS